MSYMVGSIKCQKPHAQSLLLVYLLSTTGSCQFIQILPMPFYAYICSEFNIKCKHLGQQCWCTLQVAIVRSFCAPCFLCQRQGFHCCLRKSWSKLRGIKVSHLINETKKFFVNTGQIYDIMIMPVRTLRAKPFNHGKAPTCCAKRLPPSKSNKFKQPPSAK